MAQWQFKHALIFRIQTYALLSLRLRWILKLGKLSHLTQAYVLLPHFNFLNSPIINCFIAQSIRKEKLGRSWNKRWDID